MKHLEVSGAVRPIYGSLGAKGIYMELLVKPEILKLYIYGLTFGNTESCLFLFAAQCFNIESMQKVFLHHSCL
jgi:hypothetical protein